MSTTLSFFVAGKPETQGGMRPVPLPNGRAALVTTGSAGLKAWRRVVTQTAQYAVNLAHWSAPDGPVRVDLRFFLPMASTRPAALRHAGIARHWRKPDIDKLTRAIHDSLKDAHVYGDDGQVSSARQDKYEVHDHRYIGVEVIVSRLETMPDDQALAALARRAAARRA